MPPKPDTNVVLFSFPEGFTESEYLKDYGEQKEFSHDDYYKVLDNETVKAEHYKGTDLYDLAKSYEESGYELGDYQARYSQCGGCFFKEGFVVRDNSVSDASLYQVVRTDEDTLTKYLFFGSNNGEDKISVHLVNSDKTDYGTKFSYIKNGEDDGVALTFVGQAIYYDDTNIAVIEGLLPAEDENVKLVFGDGAELEQRLDGSVSLIYYDKDNELNPQT